MGTRGPKTILVKHLAHAGLHPDQCFEMLLVTEHEALHVETPLLRFDRPPVGTGDLTTGMFLVRHLKGESNRNCLGLTAASYHAVMQSTLDAGEYELQTVAAQDQIASPEQMFEVRDVG